MYNRPRTLVIGVPACLTVKHIAIHLQFNVDELIKNIVFAKSQNLIKSYYS